MRKVKDTKIYKEFYAKQEAAMDVVVRDKLAGGVGDIAPRHIMNELNQLKSRSKSSFLPLLSEGISLYESFNGRVRLFNIGPDIPKTMPFVVGRSRNRVGENDNPETKSAWSPTIYMNMYGVGKWSLDGEEYNLPGIVTDLYSCLETGVIMYRMLIDGKSKQVFDNNIVLENLTRIYTNLFLTTMKRVGGDVGETFQQDLSRFLIAKFFLKYVLLKEDEDLINNIAYKSIYDRSSLNSLKDSEATSFVSYDGLVEFIESFNDIFYHNNKVTLLNFENAWIKSFGEGTILALEYAPYLLHVLFATLHNAPLGGSLRLYHRINDLKYQGLDKLYVQVINTIK